MFQELILLSRTSDKYSNVMHFFKLIDSDFETECAYSAMLMYENKTDIIYVYTVIKEYEKRKLNVVDNLFQYYLYCNKIYGFKYGVQSFVNQYYLKQYYLPLKEKIEAYKVLI